MPSFLAQHGPTLVENGYPIIPIKPRDKAPGKWDAIAGAWVDMWSWQQFCTRMPTDVELASWQEWPDAGAGIPCGNVIALDVDVMDADAAHKIEAMTRELLGDTPAVRYGLRPKRIMVYRSDTPFASFDVVTAEHREIWGSKPLQVLAVGRQFVAHGIHPVTRHPYEWPESSLLDVEFDQLPVITEAQAKQWATRAAAILGFTWPSLDRGPRSTANKDLSTRPAIEQALSFIPIDSCSSREDWLAIGMAIHAGLGGDGVDLWDDWSAGTSQVNAKGQSFYDGKKLRTQWSAFNRSGAGAIGPGTLFDRARSFGWVPQDVFLYQWEADVAAAGPAVDTDALIAALDARDGTMPASAPAASVVVVPAQAAAPVNTGMPNWRKGLTGGLAMFVDYADLTAVSPQPWVALGAALAAFGVLAGRRYAGPSGLRTNLYTIGIAESSGGKDYPLKCLKRLVEDAGMGRMIGGSKIASGTGLITALERQPCTIFPTDEIGFVMQAVADRKRAPKHAAEIIDNLTEFYTSSEDTFHGTAYANQKEKPRVEIVQPHLCLFGVTTPQVFWGALSSAHVTDGSLARMLIFESPCHFPDRRRRGPKVPLPDALVEIARQIAAGAEGHDTFPMGDTSLTVPNPYHVPFKDQAAEDRHYDIETYGVDMCKAHQGTAKTSIYGRLAENTFKLALIRAIADNPLAPVVSAEDMEWAFDVVEYSVNTVLRAIDKRISDNEEEAKLKRILRMIDEAGSAGMSHEELGRGAGFMGGRRRLQDAIDHLIDSEQVALVTLPREGGGRPRRVYIVS